MKLLWISLVLILGLDQAVLAAESSRSRGPASAGVQVSKKKSPARSIASQNYQASGDLVKRDQRRPASGAKACPETGCSCEPLKSLAQKCEASLNVESTSANQVYSELVIGLRQLSEERREGGSTDCPHLRVAEQCRSKLKSIVARQKPRSRHYRDNLSDELGQLSVHMVDAVSQPPRLPASSR